MCSRACARRRRSTAGRNGPTHPALAILGGLPGQQGVQHTGVGRVPLEHHLADLASELPTPTRGLREHVLRARAHGLLGTRRGRATDRLEGMRATCGGTARTRAATTRGDRTATSRDRPRARRRGRRTPPRRSRQRLRVADRRADRCTHSVTVDREREERRPGIDPLDDSDPRSSLAASTATANSAARTGSRAPRRPGARPRPLAPLHRGSPGRTTCTCTVSLPLVCSADRVHQARRPRMALARSH